MHTKLQSCLRQFQRSGGACFVSAGVIHVFLDDCDQARQCAEVIRASGWNGRVDTHGSHVTLHPVMGGES